MKKSKLALIITCKGDIYSSLKGKGYIFEKSIFFFHIGDNFTCELNICVKWE